MLIRFRNPILAVLACLCHPGVQAESEKQSDDPRDALFHYLLAECDRLDEIRAERLRAALEAPDRRAAYLAKLRRSYRELIGPFPAKGPLNPVVTGRLEADGYRIEKVHFESLPDHHVTALCYLPSEGEGPWPAVLFACGHSASGKAHEPYQKACALLAQNGFVVLSYDPISQGERTQLPEAPRFGTTTHTLLDVGARLVGRSVVWYEAWDGMRGIDYLLSRPEVDKSKPVGMTGTSGGGTQTTFLMALDDRIGPAAPSCYLMERTVKFRSSSGIADGCQHLPGEGLHGIDHIDYALMRTPRPTAVLAAKRDFFDIESTRRAAKIARRFHDANGTGEKFDLFVADNEHGMHVEHRQEAVRWMRRWLYGDDRPIVEPELEVFSEREVQVTRTGQVGSEFAKEVSVADFNLQLARDLQASRDRFAKLPKSRRQARVRELLGMRDSANLSAAKVTREGRRIVLQRPGDVPLPGVFIRPGTPSGSATILLSDQGVKLQSGKIEELTSRGEVILAVDLRGYGETRDRGSAGKYFNHEHRTANIAMHIGRPLLGQRVEDLHLALEFLVAESGGKSITVFAQGQAAVVARHAAFLDNRISKLETVGSIGSWVADVVAAPLEHHQVGLVVPGALKYYDLTDLRN